MKIELQVVGRRFEDFFVRNKGSKDKHEQDKIKKQLDENQDIVSNLGVNPRELLKEWKEKSEKWNKWQLDLHNLAQENKTPYYIMLKENKKLKELIKIAGSSEEKHIKQVQEWKEKAEKLDSYHYEKQVNELQQENKHLKIDNQNLKSDYESFKRLFEEFQKENIKLEEKLRKYEILQYTPNELEIELNKGIINKLKLEKINEYVFNSEEFLFPSRDIVRSKIKEILKDDK